MPLLTVTLYDRREQSEQCEFVGLDGIASTSTDAGCATNQEWRRIHTGGAPLRSPSEMLAGTPTPVNPAAAPRSCRALTQISFGANQTMRSNKFERSDQFKEMAQLGNVVAPLIDDINGQQLMYLTAATTAAGLGELKGHIAEEILTL